MPQDNQGLQLNPHQRSFESRLEHALLLSRQEVNRMNRVVWVVKLASRQQMLNLPLEFLIDSLGYSEAPDSSCELFYCDVFAACMAATDAGGMVLLRQSDEELQFTQPTDVAAPSVTTSK